MGGHSPFEYTCLVIAVVAIMIWVVSGNPTLALYATMIAYLIGYLPIIKKSWQLPKTENTLSWTLCALSGWINALALTTLAPQISLLALMYLVVDSLIAALLIFPSYRPRLGSASTS